jgi:hypothetical protein
MFAKAGTGVTAAPTGMRPRHRDVYPVESLANQASRQNHSLALANGVHHGIRMRHKALKSEFSLAWTIQLLHYEKIILQILTLR